MVADTTEAPGGGTAFKCPDCGQTHDLARVGESECFLLLLAERASDRGNYEPTTIARACPWVEVNALWDRFGEPATDWLEDHCERALEPDIGELRRKFLEASDNELQALAAEIRDALSGDSNDREHAALASIAETLGIGYRDA